MAASSNVLVFTAFEITPERRIDRLVRILPMMDGTTQTFVESSGSSNEQHSYPGLCFPITHVGKMLSGSTWYGKIIRMVKPDRLIAMGYDPATTRTKPIDVSIWQYELMKSMMLEKYGEQLWDIYLSNGAGKPSDRPTLYAMAIELKNLNTVIERYFATESQLVCSCCISSDTSIWNMPLERGGLRDVKDYICRKYPAEAAYYMSIKDIPSSEGIPDARLDELMKEMGAEIPLHAYDTLATVRNIQGDAKSIPATNIALSLMNAEHRYQTKGGTRRKPRRLTSRRKKRTRLTCSCTK
jgi:hypothetical protein